MYYGNACLRNMLRNCKFQVEVKVLFFADFREAYLTLPLQDRVTAEDSYNQSKQCHSVYPTTLDSPRLSLSNSKCRRQI